MAKILKFNPRKGLVGVLHEVPDDYEAGKITDFVCIYRVVSGEEKEASLRYHWFGEETCTYMLGLLDRMKGYIMDWIRESEE